MKEVALRSGIWRKMHLQRGLLQEDDNQLLQTFFFKVNGAYCNFMPAVIIVAINTQYDLANTRSLFFLNGSLK